jgi:hypothetical protein
VRCHRAHGLMRHPGGGIEGNSILQNGSGDKILTPEQAGVVLGPLRPKTGFVDSGLKAYISSGGRQG